jgi:hypothetical protein
MKALAGHDLLTLAGFLLVVFCNQAARSDEPKDQVDAARFVHVDIQPHANQRIDEDFYPGDYPGDSLVKLERGTHKLGGVDFAVSAGLIQVSGKFLPDHPARVGGIKVGQRVEKMYFLHAARWGAYGNENDELGHWVADGTPIGFYKIVYEDSTTETFPIIYGVDVRDWWSIWDDSKPTKRSNVVWIGNNPHLRRRQEARHTQTPLRLYLSTWENPRPSLPVSSLDMISASQTATPFCVAITLEKPAEK